MRLLVALILFPVALFAATESVSIDTKTKKVQNPIVNFGAGNTLNGTGATIIGFPGSSYTFIDSLTQGAGNVSLVNDSASPGNSKYYGTDSGGTLGYFDITGGGSTSILPVLYATFVEQNLAGSLPIIDSSQTSENDRVLLFGQADAIDNGIWLVHEHSAWTRPSDFAAGLVVPIGTNVYVISGTQYPTVLFNLYGGRFDVYTLTVGTSEINAQGLLDVTAWTRNSAGHVLAPATVIFANAVNMLALAAPSGQTRLVISDQNGLLAIATPTATPTPTATATSTATATATATSTPTPTPSATATAFPQGFTAHFSRGGAALQANDVTLTPWTTKYPGTITGFIISADQGTCTLKVWKKATGTAIPTIADVINTSGVSLATGTHIDSTTVTDFTTTTVSVGDQFMAQITAVSGGATDITFQIPIRQ